MCSWSSSSFLIIKLNFFHLVVAFSTWKTQDICVRYYYLGTSEGGLVQGYGSKICPSRSHRVLLLYTCCSVTKSCPTLRGSMNYTVPHFPVLHCLPEIAQIHVCWVSDAVYPSHPLLPPFPFAFNLSQHQDLYLFAIQGTLKSLLQHHSFKASVLQHSAFFMVQLSHLHMTTGNIRALTIWNLIGKMMSLLFNMLSRFTHCRWWLQLWN